MVDVFSHHIEALLPQLDEFLMYIYSVVAQPGLDLSMIGMHTLSYLIDKLGANATDAMWDSMLEVVQKIFQVSTPVEFVKGAIAAAATDSTAEAVEQSKVDIEQEAPEEEAAAEDFANIPANGSAYGSGAPAITPRSAQMMIPGKATKNWVQPTEQQFEAMKLMCTVQLLMINTVGEMWKSHGRRMLSRHILILVECLETACSFAHEFNSNRGARTKLWNPELISTPPDLIEQEIQAVSVYLSMLLSLYGEKTVEPEVRHEMAEHRLMRTISNILERYITKTLKPTLVPEEKPEMMAFTPVVIEILQGINGFSDEQLEKHLSELYLPVVEMTNCTTNQARMIVKDILIRIGHLRGLMPAVGKP
jgi:brefeldin A-inhibited guanine nucleotide-exchange protein